MGVDMKVKAIYDSEMRSMTVLQQRKRKISS